MKMNSYVKALVFLTFSLLSSFTLKAQSVDLELISNLGDTFINPSMGELESTVGEVITETYDACVITNGFLQTYETANCGFETTSTNTIISKDFELFPNPAFAELNIITPETKNFELRVISTNGKIIFTNAYKETNSINLDVSNLQNGVFFLELIAEDLIYNKSFIKITDQ